MQYINESHSQIKKFLSELATNSERLFFFNAEGENRTPTMLKLITRSLVLRVYQFRHPRAYLLGMTENYYTLENFCVKLC